MPDNLSNAHNEDEQTLTNVDNDDQLQKMFEASYAGNDEESSRLQESAKESDDATTATEEETSAEESTDQVDEDSSITIASTDMNAVEETTPAPQETSTEDLAALRDQLHRARSDAGRVPHLNRRVQELERELKSLRTPATEPENKSDLPTNLKSRLEKMKEIDPETAELMEEMFKAASAETNEVKAAYQRSIRLQQEKEDREHLHNEYQKVVSAIPEAEEVFRSPEWAEWKKRLTPNHLAMADSIHSSEVITALQAFKYDAQQLFGGYKWGKPAAPTPPVQEKSTAARAAESSRARVLQNSAAVRDTNPARATTEPDLEALFKAAFEDGIKDYPGIK